MPFDPLLSRTDHPDRSHPDLRGNLRRSQHRQPRHSRLQPPLEVISRRTRTKKHGLGRTDAGTDKTFQRIGDPPQYRRHCRSPLSRRAALRIRRHQRDQFLFQPRVERDHPQRSIRFEQRLHQPPPQRLPRRLHQQRQALRLCCPASTSASRIVPRSRIETRSRNSCCSTFCTSPSDSSFGTSSSTSLGWLSAQRIEQPLGLCAAQQFLRMPADQLRQMRADHRPLVDHRIARRQRLLLERRLNPSRRRSKRGLPRLPSRGVGAAAASVLTASRQFSSVCQRPISMPRSETTYSRGPQPQVVRDVHRRNKNPSSAARCRRSVRTRLSIWPPCFSSTSGIS